MLQLPALLSFSFSLLFSLMFSVVLSVESTTNSNIYVQCSQLYFDSMTPYESNVNSLFTSLVDSSSICNFNKFQISPPAGYSQNDVVYGLFQCRGDLSSSNCKECVTSSVSQLKTNCPVSTGGEIQLDGCFVKYDNSSFFGADDKMEVLKRCGPSVGYNSDVLNRVDAALANLIAAGNGQYFRSCDYGSIQGVAQCVQDLSVSDCQDCLSQACGRLRSECETSAWGDIYLGKCYIRYVDQDNDNHGKNCASSCGNSEGGNDNNIWKVIGYIAAALSGGGFTLSVAVSININYVKKLAREAKEQAAAAEQKATSAEKSANDVKKRKEEKDKQKTETKKRKQDEEEGGKRYPKYGMPPCHHQPMYGMPPCPCPCPMQDPNPDHPCTIQ